MNKQEKIQQLEEIILNQNKEIRRRDVLIANLDKERIAATKIRTQTRRLLGMIDRRIASVFSSMKHRPQVDRSEEAKQLAESIELKQTPTALLQQAKEHDQVAYVAVYEPSSLKTKTGEVLSFSYALVRRTVKTAVFTVLRALKRLKP